MAYHQGHVTEDADRRKKFYHPYAPYDIQLEFMRAVYRCLEEGSVGIFESPTGKSSCSKIYTHPMTVFLIVGT